MRLAPSPPSALTRHHLDNLDIFMELLRKFIDRGRGTLARQHRGGPGTADQTSPGRASGAPVARHIRPHTRRSVSREVNASFDETERRAAGLAQQLDVLAARVDDFTQIVQLAQTLETRVQRAEERVERTLAGETHIQEHRDAVQQLVSLGQGTLAQVEWLKHESAALARLEERLPRLRMEIEPLLNQHAALRTDLDLLRGGIAALAQDAETGRDASLKARAHATKATEVVADLQRKLEPLSQLHALTQDTEAQVRSLNTLAEHVATKVKALENQQTVVDHALVESRRLHEMVWDMEVQINKVTEGSKKAVRAREMIGRLERIQAEAATRLEEAARAP